MIKILKSNRCKKCKKRRGTRFCLRSGKNICWHDCNILRVEMKCSDNCRYALKTADDSDLFSIKTNANSNAEYQDLLKRQIERWVMLPQEIFGGKTPVRMAENETDKKLLMEFFSQFDQNKQIPLSYLYHKLSMDYPNVMDEDIIDHESVANEYLNKLIEQDWESTIEMLYLNEQYADAEYKENYLNRLSSNKIIKKLVEFDLISAALNKEQNQALVHYEVNGKYDLTILLRKRGEDWKVGAKIFGEPDLFSRENEAIKQVATLLSQNQLAHAFDILKKYSAIFTDSPDFQYYWGFYYLLSKMEQKAKPFLFNAVEIEPGFFDAKALYATTLISEKKYDRAKKLYEEIIEVYPDEIKTLNNLASIHLEQGNYDEAEILLKRCLKIDGKFEYALLNMKKIADFRENN
ncbi:MAG: tetratricopeptide repeat protein [Candidatus Cloacimonetes bacterium]|nr:tetratricopeptide repeat protein [Candidatus Cloacimonadota bacterium]